MSVIGILPASGLASRMRGLPKFLLPLPGDRGSILEYHIDLMAPHVDTIFVPTRTVWLPVLEGLELHDKVQLVEKNTDTLARTVRETLEGVEYDHALAGLPDTVFQEGNPYENLRNSVDDAGVSLCLFPTRAAQRGALGSVHLSEDGIVIDHADKNPDKDWGAHWGLMRFSKSVLELLSPESQTIGVLIDECLQREIPVTGFSHQSEYFDCGTVAEYARCLSSFTNETVS